MSGVPLFKFQWQEAVCGRGHAALNDLTPTERLVAFALSTWMDADGAGARPGVSRLCKATGRRRRDTVTTALAELERKGYLECVHRGGRGGAGASVYVARLPAALATPGDQEHGHEWYPSSHSVRLGLVTSADEASHLTRTPSVQYQSRITRTRGVCGECEIGGGHHLEGCSRAPAARVVA